MIVEIVQGVEPCLEFGSKSRNLISLVNAGINVPRGIILCSGIYEEFLEKNRTLEKLGDISDKDIEQAFKEGILREEIINQIIGKLEPIGKKYYAVRSSSLLEDSRSKSFAGQYHTDLGVSKDKLEESIKKVYASIFFEGARMYRRGIHKDSMAVIIQEMISSTVSGVVFTYDLMNSSGSNILIESTLGLCEPLVSGRVNPDRYILSKECGKLVRREIGDKKQLLFLRDGALSYQENLLCIDSLDEKKLKEINNMSKKVELLFGSYQDIEWTYDNDKQYVLQSRDITAI